MKKLSISSFCIFIIAILSLCGALANTSAQCWNHDCLVNGWTLTDFSTLRFTDSSCYRLGCQASGWISGGTSGVNTYTQCKTGGCFVNGWYELDRQKQTLLKQVVCSHLNDKQDCLTAGWRSYSANSWEVSSCLDGDCKQSGWTTINNLGETNLITCKGQGCFIDGWISLH
jgi:hypothetical protein